MVGLKCDVASQDLVPFLCFSAHLYTSSFFITMVIYKGILLISLLFFKKNSKFIRSN